MSEPEQAGPPRGFGILLMLLGVAAFLGGIRLMQMGDNPYFVVLGLGVFSSGLLISRGKLLGARVFLATLAVIALWSLAEVGPDVQRLVPRLLMPSLIAVYIFTRLRSRLA